MLTQQKLKSLAAQKDQVEITQTKLTSCLEYAEGGLQTGTESEVLEMKGPVLKRIEQISAEFDPDTIQPETDADLKLNTDISTKERIQQGCQEFLEISDSGSLDLEKSNILRDGTKGAVTGKLENIVFHAMTRQNKEYEGKINFDAELEHIKSKDRIQCEVVKQQNGHHKINYRPVKRGTHELHLTVDGNSVRGSPFPIAVTPSVQSLNKPVKVIQGLNSPIGTAINSKGQMLVVESNDVLVLTPEGEKIQTFGRAGSGTGRLSNPWGVSVDKDDNIYIANNGNHRIQKFNSEGEFMSAVGGRGNNQLQFSSPLGISYNHRDDNLYIADNDNHRIQVVTTKLEFVRSFGTQGCGNGQFQNPVDVAFDDANNLYVAEYYNHRVQVLTTEGQFLRTFTLKADVQKLNYPRAIAIDSSNTVYVSEERLHCVSVFTSQGDYITTFGGEGSEEGQFIYINGLSINCNDSIIVSDYGNGRLQIY